MNIPGTTASTLPPLREDIQLLPGPRSHDGSPSWNIYDPVCNKFIRVGWLAFQLLSRWHRGNVEQLLQDVRENTTANVDDSDIEVLIKFLHSNNLTRDSASGSSADYLAQYNATKANWYTWLIRNYLFFRIPVCHPHRFLKRTMHLAEPFYSRPFLVGMLLLGLTALYLVARQWETFMNTFSYFFNVQGAVFYFFALVFIKIFHELGHAYSATRYGTKVASMGIAVLVMLPVLYTDTTDAWRLNSRKQRMVIGAGGMFAELYLAVVFTFLWSFLPDGMVRSAAFVIATTSWIMSLAINLNILMRFDGYYLLSDLLGVENMQDRSFSLGKWRLREILFDLGLPAPSKFSHLLRRKLIIYAWSVWIYRFFLFLGIALLVYHFFFKLLGLLLFLVEIIWFIVMPVVKEVRVWNELKTEIRESGRYRITTIFAFVALSLFFIPWNTRITTPAVLEATNKAFIHTVSPGIITEIYVKEGNEVKIGQPILSLNSPGLENEIERAEKEYEVTDLRSKRRASNIGDLENIQVVLEQLQELQSRMNGLYKLRDELVVRAPIDGRIVDLNDKLHPGRWINGDLQIAQVAQLDEFSLNGVIEGRKLSQVKIDQDAVFIPDEPELDTIRASVKEIENANIQVLDSLYFASSYGGPIAVREDDDNELVPEESLYRIKFRILEDNVMLPRVIRGEVHIAGDAKSFAFRTYDLIATVLVRESGF